MGESSAEKVFFEIHSDLPREAPGSAASTRAAFALVSGLPRAPLVVDMGCGPGAQTLELTCLTKGKILAVDTHSPYLERLLADAKRGGVSEQIQVLEQDMGALELEAGTVDLVWAEGAAYVLGFEKALRTWRPLLKPKGSLAATELCWLEPQPPQEVRDFWGQNYPAMTNIESNLEIIRKAGYEVIGNRQLPETDWWESYYTPMECRLDKLAERYRADSEALAVIESQRDEIDLYRKYSRFFGYVFYVMQEASTAHP